MAGLGSGRGRCSKARQAHASALRRYLPHLPSRAPRASRSDLRTGIQKCPMSNSRRHWCQQLRRKRTASAAPVDVGTPGASARREHERRHQRREESIRTKHPRLGGLILELTDAPQTTKAWQTGALGEERLGAKLNELSNDTLRLLHDRRIPGSRANIDHVAITQTGIWSIDAKKYNGRPHLKVEGGLLRARTERLLVGTRDCPRWSRESASRSMSSRTSSTPTDLKVQDDRTGEYPSTESCASSKPTGPSSAAHSPPRA